MSEELLRAIRAAIDEDEQVARAAWQENWRWYAEDKTVMTHADQDGEWDGYRATGTRADAEHIARHDPARVLRQVAAYRKILDAHPMDSMPRWRPWCTTCHDQTVDYPCDTIAALAEAYGIDTAEQT